VPPPVTVERAMAQPSPTPERPGFTFQPPCPNCGQPMWLVRLARHGSDHDLRNFECKVCDHSESRVIKFK
jgi:hypothetical protein